MAHSVGNKTKLLNRVRRIRGQVDAIERTILAEEDNECAEVMQLIAGARGAMDGLMASVMEGHIRDHMVDPVRRPSSNESRAAQELIDVLKTYLR